MTNTHRPLGVGDLCILQNADHFTEWNGALGVVVAEVQGRCPMDLSTMQHVHVHGYSIRVLEQGGFVVTAQTHQVRPLRDPGDEVVADEDNVSEYETLASLEV